METSCELQGRFLQDLGDYATGSWAMNKAQAAMGHPIPFQFPGGFAFILNPYLYHGALPVEVRPGLALDKAAQDEREAIAGLLNELGGLVKWGNLFRHEPIAREVRDSPAWNRKLWPRETYWVLRMTADAQPVQRICEASQLCDCELELGSLFPPPGTFIPRVTFPSSFYYYAEVQWRGDAQQLDIDDLRSVNSLHLRLSEFRTADQSDTARRSVVRLFDKFITVSAGKRYGDVPLLGYFALIEGLITHNPRSRSRDSITHQLSTKMPLLMKRFSRPLALGDFVEEDDPGKLWAMLYKLRSRIVHGEEGFSAIKDRQLRDMNSVFRLVRESLKRLFVLSLHEPEFLFDLKAC